MDASNVTTGQERIGSLFDHLVIQLASERNILPGPKHV